jgi:hypothetical protein
MKPGTKSKYLKGWRIPVDLLLVKSIDGNVGRLKRQKGEEGMAVRSNRHGAWPGFRVGVSPTRKRESTE